MVTIQAKRDNVCELCRPNPEKIIAGLDITFHKEGMYEDGDNDITMFLCKKHAKNLAQRLLKASESIILNSLDD